MKKPFLTLAGLFAAAGIAGAALPGPTTAPVPKGKAPNVAAPVAAAAPAKAAPDAAPLTPQQSAFFEAKVRPILASACYKCHSIEEKKAKGELLLDSRDGWQKGGENGPVIVPGDPAKSTLIKAISYADPDLQMPPNGKKLSDQQIADLTAWVKMGAPDPRAGPPGGSKLTGLNDHAKAHWAFQPVKKPPVPRVKDAAWPRNAVDSFVLAKLEQNGMKPSAPAAREALIRRATYDLIGLAPTPDEVRAFVADTSPNAFEKVVDRLLASPQYGERWGRYWLDSARYSDTSGIENVQVRRGDYRYAHAWTYRDYVIKSFNEDKPYDQFLMEQIAADQLPEARKEPARLAALGFITVGKRFANVNDTIDERIDTLTKATMALTVACARCHDHKFDPVPTADYYSLHGIFASTVEPNEKPVIGVTPNAAAYADFKAKLAVLEQRNRDAYYDLVESHGKEFRAKAAGYLLVNLYGRKNDAAMLVERNRIIAEHKLNRDLLQGGGGKAGGKNDAVFVPLMRFAELPKEPAEFAAGVKGILNEIAAGGAKRRPINPLVALAFKDVKPESLKGIADVAQVYGRLFAGIEARAQAYVKAARGATTGGVVGFDAALVQLIEHPLEVRPASELDTESLRAIVGKLNNQAAGKASFTFSEINELQLTNPGAPACAMSVEDAPTPRNSVVFIRGEASNKGPVVPRQFLEVLSGKDRKPFTQGSGRLELAQAIATKDNPLTARVLVNRLWMRHFGEGFVRTPDDLGVQSEAPSHPELLDFLASTFVEQGWSLKRMHRLVMLSNTYQQISDTNAAYAVKDPDNRLLWRANLRRLDFEAVRDTMLAFTGKLDRTIGGQPVNLTEEPYSNRRSVYGYIDRGDVPELMDQFDFPDPDMANSKRVTTIVPQQALFFMNSPMSVDVARKATSRPEFVSASDDGGRVRALYAVLFQRALRAEEIAFALDFIRSDRSAEQVASANVEKPADDADAPSARATRKLAKKQLTPKAPAMRKADGKRAIQNQGTMVDRKPLTTWERYAQALLCTNEIAYVN